MTKRKFDLNKKITDKVADTPEAFHDFYTVKWKNNRFDGITINLVKLVAKFKDMGVYRYDTNEDDFILCQITDNLIRRISQKEITDMFEEYILDIPPIDHMIMEGDNESKVTITGDMLLPYIYNQLERLFAKKILERLRPDKPIELQEDTLTTKYIYFKNGFIEVTADKIIKKKYKELSKKLWKSNIMEHEFEYTEKQGNFEKFIFNLSSMDQKRKKTLQSMLGYLIHDFYEYKNYMVLLTDTNIDNGEPNGRTGKTLIGKALSHVLNQNPVDSVYTEIDGKTFNPKDSKKYMSADIDTKLIHINDIFAWFNIENLFTDITDGIKVHHHYEKPFIIWSKLMMSSNKTIQLRGASAWDRVKIFEVSNHYSEKFNPEMEFKQWFFRDWDREEWNKFYSFMIRCCQIFLKDGIIEPKIINYNRRMLLEHTAPEFISWFEDYFERQSNYDSNKGRHWELAKRILYETFIAQYPDFLRDRRFTQRKVTSWVREYFKFKEVKYEEVRSTEDVFLIKEIPNN